MVQQVPPTPRRSDAAPDVPELARHPRFQSRNAPEIAPKFSVGGAEVDLARGTVRAPDGVETELRRQSAAVLRLLAAHRGEIVGKQAIYDAVWGDIAVTEDSLVQCIGDIRQALGTARDMLRTAPRQGYRLEAESASPPEPRRAPLLGVLLAALILVAGWIGYGARDPSSAASDGFAGPTVAVLPFENLAGGERWDRLARGLTEEVIADLATNPWLAVLADATTRPHAGETPQAVGAALGARHVVTGTIQAEGDRLRVTAALADAATGRQLWTRQWDGAADDLLAIQTAAAEALAGELAGRYSGAIARADRDRAHRQTTGSLEAYELYLLGVEHKHRFTLADYDIAEDYLHRATALDPGFAKAWVVLAIIQQFRMGYATSDAEFDVLNDRHRDYAMRALAADPNDPGALIEASRVYAVAGDLAAAERALRRAVDLAPNDADVLAIAGWSAPERAPIGRDALAWVERAQALNPDGPGWYMTAKGVRSLRRRRVRVGR